MLKQNASDCQEIDKLTNQNQRLSSRLESLQHLEQLHKVDHVDQMSSGMRERIENYLDDGDSKQPLKNIEKSYAELYRLPPKSKGKSRNGGITNTFSLP